MARQDVTWDSANKGANTTLSNGDLTFTGAAGTFGTTQATEGLDITSATGVYWEVEPDAFDNQCHIGIVNASYGQDDYLTTNANAYGYRNGGDTGHDNSYTNSGYSAFAAGTRIGVALINGKLFFRNAGTWQGSSDPATETNPAYSGLTGTWYPAAITISSASSGCTLYPRFEDFEDAMPSGFVPLDQVMAIAEAMDAADSVSTNGTFGHGVAETLDAADTAATVHRAAETVTETADGATDPDHTGLGFTVSESSDITDPQEQAYGKIVSDTLAGTTDINHSGLGFRVEEWITKRDTVIYQWYVPVVESLTLPTSVVGNLRAAVSLADGITVDALHSLFFRKVVEEGIDVSDSVTETLYKLVSVAESLVYSGVVNTNLQGLQVVSELLVEYATAGHAWGASVLEALNIGDNITDKVSFLRSVLEEVQATTTTNRTLNIAFVVAEGIDVPDSISSVGQFLELITETMVMAGTLVIDDTVYEAWVVNSETFAAWKYENYPFNSFAEVDGRYYGLTDTGLYELTGNDDAGTDIDAAIRTGLVRLGNTMLTGCPRAYLGYTSDGALLLKTFITRNGKKSEGHYTLEARPSPDASDAPSQMPTKMDRFARSTYWQFELQNVDGSDFQLDDMAVLPVLLRRRG